jgi:hypothetical protein
VLYDYVLPLRKGGLVQAISIYKSYCIVLLIPVAISDTGCGFFILKKKVNKMSFKNTLDIGVIKNIIETIKLFSSRSRKNKPVKSQIPPNAVRASAPSNTVKPEPLQNNKGYRKPFWGIGKINKGGEIK